MWFANHKKSLKRKLSSKTDSSTVSSSHEVSFPLLMVTNTDNTNCPWILDVTDINPFEANQTRFQNTATETEDKSFQDVTATI